MNLIEIESTKKDAQNLIKNEVNIKTPKLGEKKKKTLKDHAKSFVTNSYLKFIVKKAIFYFIVFFVAISLAFLIPRLIPGDPLDVIYSPPPGVDDPASWHERAAELEAYYGLDQPLIIQYFQFLKNFFTGNLGQSYKQHPRSVIDIIDDYLYYTLALIIPVVIVTFIIGNWIGARTGFEKGWKNRIGYYVSIFLQSAPFFWFAYLFLAIFSIELDIFPWGEYPPGIDFSQDFPSLMMNIQKLLGYYWNPFFVMVICFSGGWATGMRSMMVSERDSDYILYCEKLGFKKRKMRRYAMRNCLLPQLTGLNLRFNEILGATLIIEVVFLWPGLGSLMVEAFIDNDYNLIIGTFLVTILIIVIGNFLIDILYGIVDPRIRIGGAK